MDQMVSRIKRAVSVHLPGRTVMSMNDRGVWERHIVEVMLDGDEIVFFKIQTTDWNMTGFEEKGVRLFQEHGLPTPQILAVDISREILPHPYLIQEWRGGTRLGTLLEKTDETDAERIYETLGHFYRRMHDIHNERSELLIPFPDSPHPNEYMYQAEIVGGSGKKALEEGRIAQATYDRAVVLWDENLDYLKDHQPSLINSSPFLWSIYLERDGQDWVVTKISPMAELGWWDPAYNLAFLQYPPFGQVSASRWKAYLRRYGAEPERKRILLYLVMQRLCAAMGIYKAPKNAHNDAWAEKCLVDLDTILDEIERL
jgi:hypothetical protein